MKIVLTGDNHLGKKQYNSLVREQDFHDAWKWVCNEVARIKPDFFVMSGDLFDKKRIDDPITLSVATEGLFNAGGECKVIAIEGNHDGRSFIHKGRSWLEYLHEQGLVDAILRPGQIFRHLGTTFCGSPWAGRGAADAFEACAWDAEVTYPDDFLVGVFHAAPEGYVMGAGTIRPDMLLGSKFDLILMGHCHRPFNIDDRVICAGSPEICDIGEIGNGAGIWVVDMDMDTNRTHSMKFIGYEPREFYSYDIASDDLLMAKSFARATNPYSVIILDVIGDRRPIDFIALKKSFEDACNPVLVRVNDRMTTKSEVRPKSGPDLFNGLVADLLGDAASAEEFNSLLDCFERDDRDGVIPVLVEVLNDN